MDVHSRESVLDPLRIITLWELLSHKVLDKLREPVLEDGLAHPLHGEQQEANVVLREQHPSRRVPGCEQGVEIRPCMTLANITLTRRINRGKIASENLGPEVQTPL